MNSVERVLFVHAHPGDASISSGGTIALLVDAGAAVTVLTCTRGEGGTAEDELAELELAEAMGILGVTDHRYLGNADARWPDTAPRRYRGSAEGEAVGTLVAAPFGEISADIAAVITAVQPDVVVSYNEWGGDGHPDHIRTHQTARRAAEVMRVPFYAIEPEGSAATPTMATDATAVLDRKARAIAAHRSQLTVSGGEFTDSSGATAPIATTEFFRRLRPPARESTAWRDQTMFTKISGVFFSVLLGAFGGLLMTAIHQSSLLVGDVRVPWGLVLAILCSIALIAGLRVTFDTRVLPAVAAVGFLGAMAFISSPTAGGSVVVPDNIWGIIWTIAPVVVTFVVLAWPRLRPAVTTKIETEPAVKGSSIP